MNGNLFKIVLVSVVAILLAIIGGIMSAGRRSPFYSSGCFPLYPGRLIPDEGKSVVSVDVDTCFFLLFREFFNLHPFVCLWNCSAILLVEYHA